MKRAFTLIELLVVIAIIAILAAILFPVFAQAKEAAKKASDVSNAKQMGTSIQIYITDHDDYYPMQSGKDDTGAWGFNFMKFVPHNWAASGGGQPNRGKYSEGFFMNTIQPYMKNYAMCEAPGSTPADNFHSAQTTAVPAAGRKKENTTYAYNGFLSSYNGTAVANVAELPVITHANGFASGVGVGFANPAISCATANAECVYVPRTSTGCVAGNGGQGFMYVTFGAAPLRTSYWSYSRGQNWGHADTHVKFRRVGATQAPNNTDWRRDPWTQYDATGRAGFFWWNGCHAWLFRPDFDFVQ